MAVGFELAGDGTIDRRERRREQRERADPDREAAAWSNHATTGLEGFRAGGSKRSAGPRGSRREREWEDVAVVTIALVVSVLRRGGGERARSRPQSCLGRSLATPADGGSRRRAASRTGSRCTIRGESAAIRSKLIVGRYARAACRQQSERVRGSAAHDSAQNSGARGA